jgi:chorismate-pyruvate lyase
MATFEGPTLEEPAVGDAAVDGAEPGIVVVHDSHDAPPTPRRAWWDLDQQGYLSRIQKILLATDGTVTRVLEACAGEEMELTKLEQIVVPAVTADADLALSEGEDVMSRIVLLRGSQSGNTYVYAESLIVPGRLHPRLRHGLYHSDAPIGWLLWENRVETVRELMRWGLEPAGDCASHFRIDDREALISRTYRIISQRQPIMLITEKFPASCFPD